VQPKKNVRFENRTPFKDVGTGGGVRGGGRGWLRERVCSRLKASLSSCNPLSRRKVSVKNPQKVQDRGERSSRREDGGKGLDLLAVPGVSLRGQKQEESWREDEGYSIIVEGCEIWG
jgi:hypothetical protein